MAERGSIEEEPDFHPRHRTARERSAATRFVRALAALLVFVLAAADAGCGGDDSDDGGNLVTIRMVRVSRPGNAAVGIVPFKKGIYRNCQTAPAGPPRCRLVGRVDHPYEIGELEVTVAQYVAFLNTVDPLGQNRHDLYVRNMGPSRWPKYGQIRRSSSAAEGGHYSIAYPQWANKPVGLIGYLRAARFVNSLINGETLSVTKSSSGRVAVNAYKVRLSRDTEQGMYDLANPAATRARSTGFVLPSQDEWIKAAYYDPKGGGKFSYWQYPTGPSEAPNASSLNPSNGDVVNSAQQPLSSYSPQGPAGSGGGSGAKPGTFPDWCPPQVSGSQCKSTNPLGLSAKSYQSNFQGNLSTVGQTQTRSPWGTLDQGGNVVEWTDTIARSAGPRLRRRLHGGIANAKAYQLWISAIGRQAQRNGGFARIYPWLGFRVAFIGGPS
jgi:formylglycine-generating enzyme required for sulfatase activity